MIKKKLLLLFIVGLGMAGCTPYHLTLTNEGRSYPVTNAKKVQLFFQGETVPPAKEIGNIVVVEQSEKKGVEFLQEQAATIGADAVTNLEVKVQTQVIIFIIFPIPQNTYFVSGTAVKYTN